MALYPSLEDLKVDQMMRAQDQLISSLSQPQPPVNYNNTVRPADATEVSVSMYPSLNDYMGLELSEEIIAANMPEYLQVSTRQSGEIASIGGLIAPISGQSAGLARAHVSGGVRQLVLCKDGKGKIGLRVKPVNKGVFVCLVEAGSPAALAGLRFGDQILEVNNVTVAGYTMDQVHKLLRESPVNGISVIVRDRPFERSLTLHKDSLGQLGFQFKHGKIINIVKDSTAARNGVLIDHNLLEVNGQNVVGMKDKEIQRIIEGGGKCITITVIPTFIYDHMIKNMATSLLKGSMDHSVPTI